MVAVCNQEKRDKRQTRAGLEGVMDGTLKADFTRSHPTGLDDVTYEQIELALDKVNAPMLDGVRWLTLAERVLALEPFLDERLGK